MRVLVAPDKFRGTLTARQAARAIATGWRRARPDDQLDLAPMADGGEGTMAALVDALHGDVFGATVTGPRGDPVEAEFGVAEGAEGRLAVVEMASASGLAILAPSRRDPRSTTTRGTGELIRAALDHGPTRLLVGSGGSATNDGGAGMAQALGVRLLDERGRELAAGGLALAGLARVDATGIDRRLRGVTCVAATDVDNPLTGPSGASAVYAPQKGASGDDVVVLDRALAHLAAIVARDLGVDLRDEPGAASTWCPRRSACRRGCRRPISSSRGKGGWMHRRSAVRCPPASSAWAVSSPSPSPSSAVRRSPGSRSAARRWHPWCNGSDARWRSATRAGRWSGSRRSSPGGPTS